MAVTYDKLATTTLSSAASSVTFSSISGSYTDLILIISIPSYSSGGDAISLRLNGDTGTNYSTTELYGNGSTASSGRGSSQNKIWIGSGQLGTSSNSVVISHLQNYSNTTTYKTVLSRYSEASVAVEANVGLWRSTAAVNSITIFMSGGTITMGIGSTFNLYAVKAA